MKIDKKFGDRVFVKWMDACERTGWISVEDAYKVPEEVICFTNAFFISTKDGYITVAHTIGKTKDNDVVGVLHIPTKWILEIK